MSYNTKGNKARQSLHSLSPRDPPPITHSLSGRLCSCLCSLSAGQPQADGMTSLCLGGDAANRALFPGGCKSLVSYRLSTE